MSIESVMPFNHLILCLPLILLPSIFPRNRVFSSESAHLIRWPKYWSSSFNIRPSNEDSGLISFMIDWIQGTLKSFLKHNSKHQFLSAQHSLWSNSHFLPDYWKSQYVCVKCVYSFICWWISGGFCLFTVTHKTAMNTCALVCVLSCFSPVSLHATPLPYSWASLVAQLVKNLPAMWETWVGSLGQEDALEKGIASGLKSNNKTEIPLVMSDSL